jgi:hypothetical protein
MNERRAPVQSSFYDAYGDYIPLAQRSAEYGPGTVGWAEHEKAFNAYKIDCEEEGDDLELGDTAEEVAKRGGFTYSELELRLGHAPKTWVKTT